MSAGEVLYRRAPKQTLVGIMRGSGIEGVASEKGGPAVRVLMADSRSIRSEAAAVMLESRGMQVKFVDRASKTVEVAKRFKPHVIVMGWHFHGQAITQDSLLHQLEEAVPDTKLVVTGGGRKLYTSRKSKSPIVHSVVPSSTGLSWDRLEQSVLDAAGR